jgi:hypothetical protein
MGPENGLATTGFLYAADPSESQKGGASDSTSKTPTEPSQRPYETLLPLAAALGPPCSLAGAGPGEAWRYPPGRYNWFLTKWTGGWAFEWSSVLGISRAFLW